MGVPLNSKEDVEDSVKAKGCVDTMDLSEKAVNAGEQVEKWTTDTDETVLNGATSLQMDTVSVEDIRVTMDEDNEEVGFALRSMEMNGIKPRSKLLERQAPMDIGNNYTPEDTREKTAVSIDLNDPNDNGIEMDSLGSVVVDDMQDVPDESGYHETDKVDKSRRIHFETVVDIDAQEEVEDDMSSVEDDLHSVIVDTPKTEDDFADKTEEVEPSPDDIDDILEKKPRKRKLTATYVNRFCVEQVSLHSKSSLKKTDTISSDTSSVPSDSASPNHPRFYVETNDSDDNDDDNDNDDDDVFNTDGFDNPGYSDDDSSYKLAYHRSKSSPGLHHEREKHEPELRRCDSHGNVERIVPRKDSVVMMKQQFKKKPKLLKYDESIQQWVQRHMTPERAPIRPPRPNDHLQLSCAVLLCCNVVFGIIALFFSLRSNSSYEKGEYDEAKKSSRTSMIISVLGVFVTVVLVVALLAYFWPTI